MLRGESSSSNSSDASSPRITYHNVFLSYRREGTHLNFTHHLRASLQRTGITTSPDDDKGLEREDIDIAIEESLAAIVVFSENYASSTWCLDELEKIILESKRVRGIDVFPVFYDVSPSDVRYQINSFGEAFRQHTISSEEDELRMQKWRDSLNQVAGFSGWESKNRHKAELIEDIIKSVCAKLHPKMPSSVDELVGIDSRVRNMESILRMELKDKVHFVGIWGMGGIGKETLARVVFNKIRNEFETSCFLGNVREVYGAKDGIVRLQRKLLSQMIIDLEIEDLDARKNIIREVLLNNKVLLVVDDVDDVRQLESFAEKKEWFGRGSRVIITTRDKQILRSCGVDEIYKIDFLNSDLSLQLFCQKAFKGEQLPQEHHLELSKVVVQYAGGLPLALEKFASFLCGRRESQWREVLDMIKECPENDNVIKTLRISYDGLPPNYRALFLDIACFFKGWAKEHVIQILTICDRYPPDGIEILIDKSLATYDGLHLGMHDLLQEMGRKIVIEECTTDAGKRSRLWYLEDIDQVLKNKNTEEGPHLRFIISRERNSTMV